VGKSASEAILAKKIRNFRDRKDKKEGWCKILAVQGKEKGEKKGAGRGQGREAGEGKKNHGSESAHLEKEESVAGEPERAMGPADLIRGTQEPDTETGRNTPI